MTASHPRQFAGRAGLLLLQYLCSPSPSCNSGGEGTQILVSTVDAFQGGERDVIILSSVRTKGVGFIDEPERVNVAITRAKRHLLFVGESVRSPILPWNAPKHCLMPSSSPGNLRTLSVSRLWGGIIDFCREIPSGVQLVSTHPHSPVFRTPSG